MKLAHLALVTSFVSSVLVMAIAIQLYEVTLQASEDRRMLRYGQARLDDQLRECRAIALQSLHENDRQSDWLRHIALASRVGWSEAHAELMQLRLE